MSPSRVSRRRLLQGALAATAASVGLPLLDGGRYQASAATAARKYSARAMRLIERSLVIDMLGLIGHEVRAEPLTLENAVVLRECGITAFHSAFGLEGPKAYEDAVFYLASWQGFVARNADVLSLVATAVDFDTAKSRGKIAVVIGIQNADHFRSPDDVKTFYQLGLRCSQLTYNTQNRIGSGCTDRIDGGVSDFGVEIIGKMNEAGMLVDVSHSGDRTTLDAIEISREPIAITHSNCRALNNHPRLKTDEAIRKLAAKGGVMGITGIRNFVCDQEPTTMEHIVDHIDHVVKLVGIEHVGIGSDAGLSGYDSMPKDQYQKLRSGYKSNYAFRDKMDIDGFDHPRKMYDLTEALIRRGYSDDNIAAVLGGNFRRLLGEIWV
jgi:membrane dipeptidase